MLGTDFYWGTIRRYVILFGSIFDNINIDRVDANGVPQQTIKVPLQYGPKERYLTRYIQNPDLLREVSMVFPRMSFEITGISYDPDRKMNTIGQYVGTSTSNNAITGATQTTQFNPVPYNFDISLSIISRNTEDALRIVEQIVPFFTPQWNTTLTLIPPMNYSINVPIILKSVNAVDTYSSNFEDKEWVIWDLQFTLKGALWGPARNSGLINHIIVNSYAEKSGDINSYVGTTSPQISLDITPGETANGQATSNSSIAIPYTQVKPTDNYGFIVQYTENLK
jgi:hypothetical protein